MVKISNVDRPASLNEFDGSLDVVASGKNNNNDNTTIFFWDVKTGVVQTYSDPMPGDLRFGVSNKDRKVLSERLAPGNW